MTTPFLFPAVLPPLLPESLHALGHFGLAVILLPASLAQEVPPPDAAHLSSWLVDAAALGAILLVFLKIIDHFKRKPSLEQELEKLLRQIRSELNQLRHEQTSHLSEVRGRVEGAHQRVDLLTHDLNNKLQRLPGEIVDLLHKTGVMATPRRSARNSCPRRDLRGNRRE